MAYIQTIGHADQPLRSAGFDPTACRPCHNVHADPRAIEPRLLWPRQLSATETANPRNAAANRYCLACHRIDGPVAPPPIATHPDVDMFNPDTPESPGYLPLFNPRGEVDPNGFIACRTCHLTHGRSTPAPLPVAAAGLSEREQRARQWHLRTFSPTAVCSTCHGVDALRRFMYFHDAARRSGPIDGRPASAPVRTVPTGPGA